MIYIKLENFEAWAGGFDTLEEIKEMGKLEEFGEFLEEAYQDGIEETELNDFLWYERDYIFKCLKQR